MIEELVKYWEEYKEDKKSEALDFLNPYKQCSLEGFMDYLSDKSKNDEKN